MGKVISSLFGSNDSSGYNNNGISARDILPEAKSEDPEAPVLGGSPSTSTDANGKNSVMIDAAYTKKVSPSSYSKNSLLL